MKFNKVLITVLIIAAIIVGFDIRRSKTGSFTVIRGSENYFQLPVITDDRININTTDPDELCELEGIGETLAERIIEYRTATPFSAVEDLMNVKGIGQKKFDAIKNNIRIK